MKRLFPVFSICLCFLACNNQNSASVSHAEEGIGPDTQDAVDSAKATISRWTDTALKKMDSAKILLKDKTVNSPVTESK